MATYNKELKALRVKHDLTQEEAANLLGISRVSYKNKEKGITRFYFDEVKELLKYMDELEYVNVLINE